MWCDAVGHIRKECVDFAKALGTNVVYLWNGRVHASESWKALELNTWCGGMKRLMEEATARHVEAIHYSASARIQVGSDEGRKMKDSGFSALVLEGLAAIQLRKEEADRCRVDSLMREKLRRDRGGPERRNTQKRGRSKTKQWAEPHTQICNELGTKN